MMYHVLKGDTGMMDQAVAWFVAFTDRLGRHVFHSKDPGTDLRQFMGVVLILFMFYGGIFALTIHEQYKEHKDVH